MELFTVSFLFIFSVIGMSSSSSIFLTKATPVLNFFPDVAQNLTEVTWAHAVNNKTYLENCLRSNIMMLEADIVLGTLTTSNSSSEIPIMAHPPDNTSDLSLKDFLTTIAMYNHNASARKGVKLDFKTIEVFEASVGILVEMWPEIDFPIWLNADIIAGPVNATTTPVDPMRFLTGSAPFINSTLSIGWTTNYGGNITSASYTRDQIESILEVISQNNVSHEITFPVRAGIAAESLKEMEYLLSSVPNSTLTVWSSSGDTVNVGNLRTLILTVGVDKVYVDVPEELHSQLNLSTGSTGNQKKDSFVFVNY